MPLSKPQRLDAPVQMLHIDGINIAYREYGSPAAPPMVLLHGLAETSTYF